MNTLTKYFSAQNSLRATSVTTVVMPKQNVSFIYKVICVSLFLIATLNTLKAQTTEVTETIEDDYKAFTANAHLKNMHTWHGFVVHPSAVFAASLEYNTRNSKFTFGVWGGSSFSGVDVENYNTGETVSVSYKEFSIYTKYSFSDRFFIEAVSHNNYTGVEERGDELHYWSYDKTQGYNFVDISLGYNVSPNTLLYFATILGGGSGDYEIKSDGRLEDSWTHYFEVKSKVWEKGDSNLSVFAGGAWSFITDKTFYTEGSGNLINVGATFGKDIHLGTYKLPVELTAMWNPEQEKTVLQLDLMLF
ncbi:hypothetical protein [Winogradskyella wichelsiae]|uniref:hypothetical protein n=1 Tax=Winogradskyella wichelsiae TaxID=2697007 RepID=UPI003EFAF177